MPKRRSIKRMFSLSPVEFRQSDIAGRGVFARRAFQPGDIIVPYAPKQRRVDVESAEAAAAADTKLTLVSERRSVIIPDTSQAGGWLCNHSCHPNAALYSTGEGRIQCTRFISPGQEVTIFYGWVTRNQFGRDPCHCGAPGCRAFINFDITDTDARHFETETPEGAALQRRLDEYAEFLHAIDQEQVLDTIFATLSSMKERGQ